MLRAMLLLSGLVVVARDASAQPARPGRLPVLAAPPSTARCIVRSTSGDLRQSGIVRLLDVQFPAEDRLLSLGVDAKRRPRFLMGMMSTHEGRRGEGESVSVFFDDAGRLTRGRHDAYTSGLPTRLSDDRIGDLLPGDSAQIVAVVRTLLRRCPA
jgi:hypothetical protein